MILIPQKKCARKFYKMLREGDEEEQRQEEIFSTTFIIEKASIQCFIMSSKECPTSRVQGKYYHEKKRLFMGLLEEAKSTPRVKNNCALF
jgi:hypothetical protein